MRSTCYLFLIILTTVSAQNLTDIMGYDDVTKIVIGPEEVKKSPYYNNRTLNIPMSHEAGEDLFIHWADQALSGLLAAIANYRFPMVDQHDRDDHEKCVKASEAVSSHAKCVLDLVSTVDRKKWLRRRKYFQKEARSKKTKRTPKKPIVTEPEWIGSFRRAKRSIKVVQRDSYKLRDESDRSPLGIIAAHLTNSVKFLKKKEGTMRWQTTIKRIQTKADQIKKKKKVIDTLRARMKAMSGMAKPVKTEIESDRRRKPLSMKALDSVEQYIEDEELKEMYLAKKNNMTDDEKMMQIPIKIIRDAAKLAFSLGGQNSSSVNGKSVKVISPRFLSIMPEDPDAKEKEVDLLSPSLFSLHSAGEGVEKNTSISNLLEGSMDPWDTQKWLDFVVEATGVSEAVEDAEVKMEEAERKKDQAMGLRGPDGQPLYFTKENLTEINPREAKKAELFEKLDKMYTPEQLKEANRTGYVIMNDEQLELVYGPKSMFRNPKLIKMMKNLTRAEANKLILSNIKDVADEKLKFEVRQKDILLSPIVGSAIVGNSVLASQPIILSPVLLTSLITSPSIYGAVILSPWVFVPVVLSPRVFSPIILNPFLFVPIILTPIVMAPVVLSPGMFNPFVLSPLVMVPFVLSPQVFSPLILTPFALTPLILTPLLMSPLVLSPFVLSPQVLSPQYVTGIILSPYALSPAVESNGAMVTVFASPSWLS